ncbi:DUF2306 domain-containing protein [Micromonospora sp. KC213]|uniref:DUF2306 domain-containing protein n=1 Tax=Micromonospora sp. KC213 TaxID=2530378 RepID=UPI001051E9FB|nr:DUF2306 domain-containing protein [Micromonospora sp. KC213]TDC36036.1 DUF2306 domain-containing protein [Micromonospora sp. KC213]
MSPSARREWLAPVLLLSLSVVPVLAGALRLAELAGGAPIEPENARFFAAPGPVVVHIVTASFYCLVGAFQFAPTLRRRRPGWHRTAGLLLIPCGLAAALSGLWMTVSYPQPPGDGVLLTGFRLLFGSAMVGSIVLGFAAVRRRDIARHRTWMTRGYAIGLGAGTQVLTLGPWIVAFGQTSELSRALLMLAGWLINLAVAEHVIRRHKSRRTAHRAAVAAATGRADMAAPGR